MSRPGYLIPTHAPSFDKQTAHGFVTPESDKTPQVARFLPKRVIPVIFLPGIMGSNLKITDAARQRELGQANNVAWNPDMFGASNVTGFSNAKPRERQLRLDPTTTAVDIYDPAGPVDVSGDGRFSNVALDDGFRSSLLMSDPPTLKGGRTAVQKARMRGWGEVYFGSYGVVLQRMEQMLANAFSTGKMSEAWKTVVGVDPKTWQADPSLPQQPLTEEDLLAVIKGRWFPVHAIGYNWLRSNDENAEAVAKRISAIIDDYAARKFDCDKVILVTHSMGGLLGRALVHPDMGGLKDKVFGIVHGVQPATGAAAAYKRFRAGVDDPGLNHFSLQTIQESVSSKIIGNFGNEVTAVLANSRGGLQLLPSAGYGREWLKITHAGKTLAAFPKKDPYEEIYKVQGKWYSLIREDWINPANNTSITWKTVISNVVKAKEFHEKLAGTYHECSYAHYGADGGHISFGDVIWDIKSEPTSDPQAWDSWQIFTDSGQGKLGLAPPAEFARLQAQATAQSEDDLAGPYVQDPMPSVQAAILPPTEAGDQTVPMRSADDQLRSGKFKGIFRQTGYEHQGSYKNEHAIACTLYSIVRIAQRDVGTK